MGLFRKKQHIRVEIRGFENGKEVVLKDNHTSNDKTPSIEQYRTIERHIKPLENEMVGYALSLKKERDTQKRIELLKDIVSTFYSLKDKCHRLGPEYFEYFSLNWEHLKRGCYITRYEDELKNLLHSDSMG